MVEASSPSLCHITLYQQGKAYGADLGPFKTPARQDDARPDAAELLRRPEDFLRERQIGKQWHWTALRPEAIMPYLRAFPYLLCKKSSTND